MIGRIEIENYKSIESMTLDLGRVTVLIGANGSGKSNILEAIAICAAAAANKLGFEFLYSRGVRIPDDANHIFSAFESPVKGDVSLCTYQVDSEIPLFETNVVVSSIGNYNYFEESHNSTQKKIISDIKSMSDGGGEVNPDSLSRFIDSELRSHAQIFDGHGLNSFLIFAPENATLRRFEEEGQIKPLGMRGEGLFKLLTVLSRLENHERLEDIKDRLQLIDWFEDFEIGGHIALGERSLRIKDQYLDDELAYFTQRSANEGFLFLLFYFALFVSKDTPRFFAIDNIDTSLNPKLCAELMRQLTELAVKYDKQVILTTHNPAILDGLNLHDDQQRLYVTERITDGRTRIRRVEAPRPPEKHEESVPLSEAFLRGYIGGLPKNF